MASTVVNYRMVTVGRLIAARWEQMDVESVVRIDGEIRRFMASRKDGVIYASITGAETNSPDEATRKQMVKMAEELAPNLRGLYIVFEPTGFRGAIFRSMLVGMMLLSNRMRGKVHVVSSIQEVIDQEGAEGLGVQPSAARSELVRAEIWNRSEPQ